VEVGCNTGKDGVLQLYEIRACFRPNPLVKVIFHHRTQREHCNYDFWDVARCRDAGMSQGAVLFGGRGWGWGEGGGGAAQERPKSEVGFATIDPGAVAACFGA